MRTLVASMLSVVVSLGHTACTETPVETCTGQTVRLVNQGILTLGTDFAFPPFAFDHPDTGKPSGFEVELGQALAKQLGLKILLVNRTSSALIPGVLAHRHDLAASALLDTENLRREVCTSTPYLEADLGLLARSGRVPSVAGMEDLDGRSIAVVRRSRAETWSREGLPETARVVRVEAPEDLLTVLRANEVDGVVDDFWFLRHQQVRANDVVVVGRIPTGKNYVLAAGPDNRGLMDAVNLALRRLRRNGTLSALRGKWFGE